MSAEKAELIDLFVCSKEIDSKILSVSRDIEKIIMSNIGSIEKGAKSENKEVSDFCKSLLDINFSINKSIQIAQLLKINLND
jgi:hypothetical protein